MSDKTTLKWLHFFYGKGATLTLASKTKNFKKQSNTYLPFKLLNYQTRYGVEREENIELNVNITLYVKIIKMVEKRHKWLLY